MALLFKHLKSGRWFLGWRVGKKALNPFTGTAYRKEAEKQPTTVEIMLTTRSEGKLSESFCHSPAGQSVQRAELKPAFEDYLARK